MEDLVTRLAEDHTGYQRLPHASQGGPAINYLIQSGHLHEREGGQLLRGPWHLSHTHGSHPGRSDDDEARFRMQVITATARFLLRHFPRTHLTTADLRLQWPVNSEWMRQKLTEHLPAASGPENEHRAELRPREPAMKDTLKLLDPALNESDLAKRDERHARC